MLKSDSRLLMWCVVTVGAIFCLNYLRLEWILDDNGLSIFSGRLPYWDFTNLWGGGRMALEGHVAYLFDPDRYRAALRALLSPLMLDQEWSYPPSMLLIGAPFGALPILPAYIAWTLLTLVALLFAARGLKLRLPECVLLLLSPPVLLNINFGQNGALTAALLLGGLALAPARPITAGILLGLLTIKPHLGLLVPFCLLAGRHYRTIAAAVVTAVVMVLATALFFGWQSWLSFLRETGPLMRAIMEAPYPQGYHTNAMTFFSLARSLSFGLPAAYALQIAAAACAALAAIWLWRRDARVDHQTRVALTAILTLCATPYAYTYDAVLLPVAYIILGARRLVPAPLLALAWILPAWNHIMVQILPSIGILAPALVAATGLIALYRRQAGARAQTLTAS